MLPTAKFAHEIANDFHRLTKHNKKVKLLGLISSEVKTAAAAGVYYCYVRVDAFNASELEDIQPVLKDFGYTSSVQMSTRKDSSTEMNYRVLLVEFR